MDAVRCPDCGDVRWSFFGFGPRAAPITCEICGAQMLPERRRPRNLKATTATVERRRKPLVTDVGPTVPPAA